MLYNLVMNDKVATKKIATLLITKEFRWPILSLSTCFDVGSLETLESCCFLSRLVLVMADLHYQR